MGYDCGVWIGKYVLCIFNFLFFYLQIKLFLNQNKNEIIKKTSNKIIFRVPVDPVEHACYERVLGTIVLGIGIWLAVDKASLIALLKMVENEHINQFTQPQVIEQLAYVLIAIGDASKVGIELILSNFFTTHFVCLYNTLLCTEKYY
uniref:Uncharacterized protein n=1 Tax=Glossina palpalis gambiensis TaxID=67801 RepID=A0A1B0BHA8_9MUSC